jgi:hypothetical protein
MIDCEATTVSGNGPKAVQNAWASLVSRKRAHVRSATTVRRRLSSKPRRSRRGPSTRDGHPALGPGERIVFEPYTKQVFDESFAWIASRGMFERAAMGSGSYEQSVVSFARD